MKKVLSFIVLAVSLFFANPAQAQIKLGVKGGLNVSNLKLDDGMWKTDNKAGFFIGPMVKVTVPVTGLSFDVAALYDQKEAKMHWGNVVGGDLSQTTTIKQQYIDIPVNVRYGVGLGSLANVFVFAGPQWGFNIGHKNYDTSFSNGQEGHNFFSFKNSNFSINVGLGATLLKHFQVSANYNIACGKTADISYGKVLESIAKARSRSNCWQIALGYWF